MTPANQNRRHAWARQMNNDDSFENIVFINSENKVGDKPIFCDSENSD